MCFLQHKRFYKSFFAKSVVSDDGDISTKVVKTKIKELADKMKKTEKELKKTMTPSQREVIENNIISEKVIKLLKEKNNIK